MGLAKLPTFPGEPYGDFDSSHQTDSGDLEIWGWSPWGMFLGRGSLLPLTARTTESHRGYEAA